MKALRVSNFQTVRSQEEHYLGPEKYSSQPLEQILPALLHGVHRIEASEVTRLPIVLPGSLNQLRMQQEERTEKKKKEKKNHCTDFNT